MILAPMSHLRQNSKDWSDMIFLFEAKRFKYKLAENQYITI